jgi:hypothetical protein
MFVVEARTTIHAPIATVWAVLMDLEAYSEWSTMLIVEQPTPLRLHGTVRLRLSLPNGPAYSFVPEIVRLEENKHFAWRQKTGIRGIFDGEHHFILTPVSTERTELHNYERYSGLLSPIIKRLPMMQSAPSGFKRMNDEIKHRSESLASGMEA